MFFLSCYFLVISVPGSSFVIFVSHFVCSPILLLYLLLFLLMFFSPFHLPSFSAPLIWFFSSHLVLPFFPGQIFLLSFCSRLPCDFLLSFCLSPSPSLTCSFPFFALVVLPLSLCSSLFSCFGCFLITFHSMLFCFSYLLFFSESLVLFLRFL